MISKTSRIITPCESGTPNLVNIGTAKRAINKPNTNIRLTALRSRIRLQMARSPRFVSAMAPWRMTEFANVRLRTNFPFELSEEHLAFIIEKRSPSAGAAIRQCGGGKAKGGAVRLQSRLA